jgi:competence protein ComEA
VRPVAVLVLVLVAVPVVSKPANAGAKSVQGAVNLNTAPPEILSLLPGIGPSKAQSILAYRKRHPFRTVDELVRIKGIGRKMVRALRPHLAVGGPTTALAADAHVAPPPPPPPPPPVVRRPVVLACVRPALRPARPVRAPRPSHGACPAPP